MRSKDTASFASKNRSMTIVSFSGNACFVGIRMPDTWLANGMRSDPKKMCSKRQKYLILVVGPLFRVTGVAVWNGLVGIGFPVDWMSTWLIGLNPFEGVFSPVFGAKNLWTDMNTSLYCEHAGPKYVDEWVEILISKHQFPWGNAGKHRRLPLVFGA